MTGNDRLPNHFVIAKMTVFNVAGLIDIELVIEKRQALMTCNVLLPTTRHEDNIPNKFRILKERQIQKEEKTMPGQGSQLPGWTKF